MSGDAPYIPLKRKILDMLNPFQTPLPPSSPSRSSKGSAIPKWEVELTAALVEGITAKRAFELSSSTRGNWTYTSEFVLPGEIPVLVESSPSPMYWGAVDFKIVIDPRPPQTLAERPGCILPMSSAEGLRQGQVTAFSRIHVGGSVAPGIIYLYVNRRFSKRWQHVCDL